MAEFGVCEPQGIRHVGRLRAHLEESAVPEPGRTVLALLLEQLDELEKRIGRIDAEILAWHRANPAGQRLAKNPGVGPLIASAIVATVADASVFRSGREFAAWLGLVPRQKWTGGKPRLGRITHQGDAYIRRLLIIGAQSALQRSREVKGNAWVQALLDRCARLKVAVALANKTAHVAWASMAKGDVYRRAAAPAAEAAGAGGAVAGVLRRCCGAQAAMPAASRTASPAPTFFLRPVTVVSFR